MKYLTFQEFLLEKKMYEANDRYSIFNTRGVFDNGIYSVILEDALYQAFLKNVGLKDGDEGNKEWNKQLDDNSSPLMKEMPLMRAYKEGQQIRYTVTSISNIAESIKVGVAALEEVLKAYKSVLAGGEKTAVFLNFKKDALAYAEKSASQTPFNPAEIIIEPGKYVKDPGIRAKEYYEAGQIYVRYNVYILLDDGRAIYSTGVFNNLEDAKANKGRNTMKGHDLEKFKTLMSDYEKALDAADKNVAGGGYSYGGAEITIYDHEGTFKGKTAEADKIMKNKVIPSLKKTFKDAKITF